MTVKTMRMIRTFCVIVALFGLVLTGCGGGGVGSVMRPPVVENGMQETLRLPVGHGLTAGEITVQPGASAEHGNVVVSCPAGGAACVVTVAADGMASYERTGGVPTVMAALATWDLPDSHGLTAGEITVQPGASAEHGNVVVSCPAGGAACVVTVAADGMASYERTGGVPTVMAALATWDLPAGHGLTAGEITVQPGASARHGNDVVSCPAGGAACVVTVAADGTASYDRTGGIPTYVMLVPPEEFPELPLQQPVHGAQAPIVDLDGILHIGANVAPPAGELTAGGTYNGVGVSSGRVQDGVGADRVIDFLEPHVGGGESAAGHGFTLTRPTPGLVTFPDRPTVRLAAGTSAEFAAYAVRAVQLINAALPYEKRMVLDTNPAPPLAAIGDIPDGQIFIDFAPSAADWNLANRDFRPGAAGIAEYQAVLEFNRETQRHEDKRMRASHVWFDTERILNAAWVLNPETGQLEETVLDAPVVETDMVRRVYPEEDIFAIMVHELIHAIGFPAHNDADQFPDSVMRDNYLLVTKQIPTIDREALLAAYSRFDPGTQPEDLSLESLGSWADTSFHLRGDLEFPGGEAAFGVASRNGLVQPWASGPTPWTNLEDNPVLLGTVTWNGALLGITPSVETVAGGARLAIELERLDGQLDFTNMEYWAGNVAPGQMGTGTTWGDGDLGYTVEVRGNTFVQTGGDDGEVTGAFFGDLHEAMGGVVERTDLTAGFGGTR